MSGVTRVVAALPLGRRGNYVDTQRGVNLDSRAGAPGSPRTLT